MDWFEKLFGFQEQSPEVVQRNFVVDGEYLTSKPNGRTFRCGVVETPTLAQLRKKPKKVSQGKLKVRNITDDASELHRDSQNAGSLIQAASQFNLLEMVGPDVTPERGVTGYIYDRTQGPICAMAATAGTVYRNYFVEVNGRIGQTKDNQIDCLQDVHNLLSPDGERLWEMRNGYALLASKQAQNFHDAIEPYLSDDSSRDQIRSQLRIGLHWDVEVTHPACSHNVSQAYCSALPLGGYSVAEPASWREFDQIVLEASYEAVLLAAASRGCSKVFLTKVGGGVFGAETSWILKAIGRACEICADYELDVRVVHYSYVDSGFESLDYL